MAAESEIRAAQALIAAASLDPRVWPEALTALARAAGGTTGQLVGMDARGCITTHWLTGVPEVERRGIEEFGLSDPRINPRLRIGRHAPLMRLVADQDHVDHDTRRRHPIYAEVFDRLDLAHNCQVVLVREDDVLLRASVTRTQAEGAFTAQDFRALAALAPHLQAAVRLQLILESARNEALLEPLEAMSAPALLLDERGLLVGATRAAEALIAAGDLIRVRARQIRAAVDEDQPALDHALQSALARVRGELGPASAPLRLKSAAGGAGLTFEVQPLVNPRTGLARSAAAIMIARAGGYAGAARRTGETRLDHACIRREFGLTRAEAEVAEAVVNGLTSNEIAGRRGVSPETVHSQVKAVLAKTHSARRAGVSAVLRPYFLD